MGGVTGCIHASVSCLGASGVLLLVPMGMMLHHALGHAPPGNMYSDSHASHAMLVSPAPPVPDGPPGLRPPSFWLGGAITN